MILITLYKYSDIMNTQLSNLTTYKNQLNLDKAAEALEKVNQKFFTGKDLKLKEKANGTNYSLAEFAWIQIVSQLKSFGFQPEALKILRKNLIEPFSACTFAEMFDSFNSAGNFDNTERKMLDSISEKEMKDLQETKNLLLKCEDTPFISWLTLMIAEYLIRRKEMYLLVFPSGEFFIWLDEKTDLYYKHGINELRNQPHISISIGEILKSILPVEKEQNKMSYINKDESEVLRYIREKNLSSLTLRFKDKNKISLIEASEKFHHVDVNSRYIEHLLKKGYQDVSFTTKEGRIVHFERVTKQKLND